MNTLLFFIYALALTYASLSPGGSGSFDVWDKLLHFIAYALFALLGRGVVKQKTSYYKLCVGIVAYGGAMEYLQSLVPGREMSALDLVANTLGVVAMAIAIKFVTDKLPG